MSAIDVMGSVSTGVEETDPPEQWATPSDQPFVWTTGSLTASAEPAAWHWLAARCALGSTETGIPPSLFYSIRRQPPGDPSAGVLLGHALAALRRPTPDGVVAGREAAWTTDEVLRSVVVAGQPTPQVAIEEDGSVDTSWLVNHRRVSLYVTPTGEGYVSSVGSPKADDLDIEFDIYRNPLDVFALAQIRDRLTELGRHARHRIVR